ncbi:MAG: hypothetical protein WD356_05315, partial [Pseudomonadales bacterium]
GGYSVHKLNDGQFVFRNADGRLIPEAPPYRGTDHEDLDDATFAALIEQIAARHVPRGVCEQKSCEPADVMQDNSYTPRGTCEAKSRNSAGMMQDNSYTPP